MSDTKCGISAAIAEAGQYYANSESALADHDAGTRVVAFAEKWSATLNVLERIDPADFVDAITEVCAKVEAMSGAPSLPGEHIDSQGRFQSDKYTWCAPDFVPLKVTDKAAQPLLWMYAKAREDIDRAFSDDLRARLRAVGFDPLHYWPRGTRK